jgi:hypothetical protein
MAPTGLPRDRNPTNSKPRIVSTPGIAGERRQVFQVCLEISSLDGEKIEEVELAGAVRLTGGVERLLGPPEDLVANRGSAGERRLVVLVLGG